jgi:hypothetical protein
MAIQTKSKSKLKATATATATASEQAKTKTKAAASANTSPQLSRKSRNVIDVYIRGIAAGGNNGFYCDPTFTTTTRIAIKKLEKKHLDTALERKAIVLDNGDFFCAMQGKFDKRGGKDSIRPEHNSGDYLDALVSTAATFNKPFTSIAWILGRGNHETAIRKNHETDLTDRLAEAMRHNGTNVLTSGYGGWVRFLFEARGSYRQAINLHHYHGSGGGGPVTRGVIQTNRMAVYTPDADIVLTGHTHDSWLVPIPRQRINGKGTLFHDEQLHVRAPGYKDAWDDGYAGWEVETAKAPKPKGAYWLRFFYFDGRIHSEVTAAK